MAVQEKRRLYLAFFSSGNGFTLIVGPKDLRETGGLGAGEMLEAALGRLGLKRPGLGT